jgi:hypothetical protein
MTSTLDYWIKGVELPQVRGRLIHELLDLSDEEYQKFVWGDPKRKHGFYSKFTMTEEMIFDDMNVKTDEEPPYDPEHYVLKSDREAELLLKVAQEMDNLTDSVNNFTNEEYLNSPYWPKVISTAKEAYKEFIKNEQDNKEFLEFIEIVKANMRKNIEKKRAK